MRGRLAGLLGVALLITSCGLIDRSGDDAVDRDATVVVLVPEDTASGEGVAAAVEAALADTGDAISGWNVEVEVIDAAADGDALADLAREVANDDVIAVIGGLSTDTVRAVQPVFEAASLLFVSPADTAPEHVRGADPANPLRPYSTYFRTTVSGDAPVQALARHAVGVMGINSIAVIDAGDAEEADQFASAVREAGGEVLRVDERNDDEKDDESDDEREGDDQDPERDDEGADPDGGDDEDDGAEDADGATTTSGTVTAPEVGLMLAEARDGGAQGVFVAGRSTIAALVADEVAQQGHDMELFGGSVLLGDDFLAEAGSSAEGAWSVRAGALSEDAPEPPPDLEERFAPVGHSGALGAAAFDAGLAVSVVLERCLPSAATARAARLGCLGEMAEISVHGLTGEVAFDEFGDRLGAAPVVMTVRGGTWESTSPVD